MDLVFSNATVDVGLHRLVERSVPFPPTSMHLGIVFDKADEVIRNPLKVRRFDPVHVMDPLKVGPQYGSGLKVKDGSADAYAVDQRIFQRNVVGEAFGQRQARASWFVNTNVNGPESSGYCTSIEGYGPASFFPRWRGACSIMRSCMSTSCNWSSCSG